MELIDSEGRLFGYVNVIDALVVLFVLAVLVAGVALVAGGGGGEEPESSPSAQYATLTIGPLSGNTSAAFADSTNLTVVRNDARLEVVDSVRTPHPNQDASFAIVRVRLPPDAGTAALNRSFDVTDGQLSYSASLSAFTNESSLERGEQSVVLETAAPERVAGTVESGDTYRVGGETVATVTDVQRLGTQGGQRQLRLGLDVSTVRVDGTEQYAQRSLRLGTALPFRTESYSLSGALASRTSDGLSSENVIVGAETTVPETVADNVDAGDTFSVGPTTVATIDTVSAVPTGSGSDSRLSLNLSLRTATFDNETEFLGRSLRPGTTVPFQTAEYTLGPTIVSLEPEALQRRTVTTRLQTTVSGTVADSVAAGDEYRINEGTVAEIDEVTAYPVAGSSRQRLSLAVSLQTVVEDGTPQFLNSSVRIGSSVPFETAEYRFSGTVVSLDSSRVGTPADATMEIEWENVRPSLSESVSPGLTETHRGADAAITGVERSPATVILRTESGEIFARDHPVNEDVTLTVAVEARQTDAGFSFHGRQVQTGDRVVLDFGSVTVSGTVSDLGADT